MSHSKNFSFGSLLIILPFFSGSLSEPNAFAADTSAKKTSENEKLAEKNSIKMAKHSRPATVLLITSSSLAQSWQPFADWKTRCGKSTKIVTVQTIEKEYKGKDIQQKIRQCVQQHIKDHQTRWVVLGGDSQPGGKGLVPDRDTPHIIGRYKDIPTDLYYISDKNWDADGDGIYGHYEKDKKAISYTGGACIGRIPVRTVSDVKAYTEKVIAYESNYPTQKFANKFLYICTMQAANYKSDMYWDRYLSKKWEQGSCQKFFVNKSPWDKKNPGDYALSAEHWAERINAKTAGKMHIHGHGLLQLWAMEGRDYVSRKTVKQLKNKNAYPIITTVSCFTGEYDSRQDPSIAESMLRAPSAGAIVMIAPSRPGVPIFHKRGGDPHDKKTQDGTTRTLTNFWINGLSKNLTTGEAFALTKAEMTKDAQKNFGFHWCQCEINLLGDPTLDMRAENPKEFIVKAPEKINATQQDISIKVGKPSMTVCLWKGDEVYQVAKTDQDGNAILKIHPKTAGKLLLAVSGPSANTYTKVIGVIVMPE